jgi:hypothetical protein
MQVYQIKIQFLMTDASFDEQCGIPEFNSYVLSKTKSALTGLGLVFLTSGKSSVGLNSSGGLRIVSVAQ